MSAEIAAAMMATKGLMKGVSPSVRASGPFQKQINQANKQAMSGGMKVAGKALGSAFGAKPATSKQAMSGGMKVAGKALGRAFGKAGK
jgi:hypothetical protein